uniref:Uncharacterized protein n=1 Tax=Rhizophora mucronata TaxID=61149 RepID=A0A2P2N7C0_RHIMU
MIEFFITNFFKIQIYNDAG